MVRVRGAAGGRRPVWVSGVTAALVGALIGLGSLTASQAGGTDEPAAGDAAAGVEQAPTGGSAEQGSIGADSQAEAPEAPEAPEVEASPSSPPDPLLDAIAPAAGGPSLGLDVSIVSDGTGPFDADDSAGNDSGPNNDQVRVNDTVTYRVQYSVSGARADNTTFRLAFPQGMELTGVPPYCDDQGSSLTPATVGSPALPLTASSINSLAAQTLTCNVGSWTNTSQSVNVTAKVLNLVHQGQDLQLASATLTADGAEPVTGSRPTVTTSARLMWDLSKNGVALTENSAGTGGPTAKGCYWDMSIPCFETSFTALVSAPSGGKGAMPAVGDVGFTESLTPQAMYPSLPATSLAAIKSNLDKYGSRIRSCAGFNTASMSGPPGYKIGASAAHTVANSVRDSGTCSFTQSGPGRDARIKVTNADMTLRTAPVVDYASGAPLPAGSAYAISFLITIHTPVVTVQEFGTPNDAANPTSWTLATRNAYTDLALQGFTAQDRQASDGQPIVPHTGVTTDGTWNDYRTTTPNVNLPGGFSKQYAGVPGAPGNMAPTEYSPTMTSIGEGPPGDATRRSGSIVAAPGQSVTSLLVMNGSRLALPADVSIVACDSWDNSKINLQRVDAASPYTTTDMAAYQRVPSEGSAVWVSGYSNVASGSTSVWATSPSQVPELEVQYSAKAGGSGAASECGAGQGPWYDDPASVPGNDPALLERGIYTAVSRVRVGVVLPPPVASAGPASYSAGVSLAVSIGLRVSDAPGPSGTIVPNWASQKRVNFAAVDMAAVIADPGSWSRSSYNPATHVGVGTGDRLTVALAQARLSKTVREGGSGDFSKVPPSVTGGQEVQFQLSPTLTSAAPTGGAPQEMWVEDCLPPSVVYSSASTPPALVSASTPPDAKVAPCAGGGTYVRWVFPSQGVNAVTAPIVVSVVVNPGADDGVYTNTATVWAQGDPSPPAARTDSAQVTIANIAGVSLQKSALTPVTQVNRPGQAVDELNRWAVTLRNTLPPTPSPTVFDPDVIDVLPVNAATPDPDVDASAFSGSLSFVGARVTAGGAGARLLYTSAAGVVLDPRDPSNGPAGATTWCDAPSGGVRVSGTGACPGSGAEVTGVRAQRPGGFASGEVLTFEVSMVGVDNRPGDTYVNAAFARVGGLDLAVGPDARPETVIGSSVGDRVWRDQRVPDGVQGADEPAVEGVSVRLAGVDDLGNRVDLSTTTDEDGRYVFPHLRASATEGYRVTFTAPDGWDFTVRDSGADDGADSDADPVSGAVTVELGPGREDGTVDAGLWGPAALVVNKIGQDVHGDWVGMDGSTWAVRADDGGAAGARVDDVSATAVDGRVGGVRLDGLAPGSYWLEEVTAPAGFSLLARPVAFTVGHDRTVTFGASQELATGVIDTEVDEDSGELNVTVRDVPAAALPAAGATPSALAAALGALLLAGALVTALIWRRRHGAG